MMNFIVYKCGAVIMKSTQRRYRIIKLIVERFIYSFTGRTFFNPRMNSFFVILLLKTDPELQNEDVMMREVKRLVYLNTVSLLASKQPSSNLGFLFADVFIII